MKQGNLYLIPITIAENTNNVISPSVTDAIKNCNHFLVENIRTARRFISSLKLGLTIEELHFQQLDKKTEFGSLQKLMTPIKKGHNIGVMSEAGCPGVADPGALAAKYAHQNNIRVIPLVGPSSILMALMASGFNGQSFAFHGYIPIDKQKRKAKIKELEKDCIRLDQTQLFMDTPYRNNQLLSDLLNELKPNTLLSISADVTGESEYIGTKPVLAWKKNKPDLHKKPAIFSIYSK